MKKKLLLHVCCAPCAVYVWQKLAPSYNVSGYFYNPNIHPRREFDFRKKELQLIAEKFGWQVVIPPYQLKEWFVKVKGLEKEPERGSRCSVCFHMRLRSTFEYARRHSFEVVASTLSISPYKVTRQINEQGLRLSREFQIEFLAENFKKEAGFEKAKKLAIKAGIKHQDYCGCVFSKVDKILKSRK